MPVVAVCPVHGAFESRGFRITGSTNVTLRGNSETCPYCGRLSAVMEGTYNFDASGLAQALSAPDWSKSALRSVQERLRMLERIIANRSISDEVVDKWVDHTVEQIQTGGLSEGEAQLADAIAARVKGRPRHKALVALGIILAVIGGLNTVADGIKLTSEVIQTMIAQAERGLPVAPVPARTPTRKAQPLVEP